MYQGVTKASKAYKVAQRAPERRRLARNLLAVVQNAQIVCECIGTRHRVARIMV